MIKFDIKTYSVEKHRMHLSQQVYSFLKCFCDEHSGGRASGNSKNIKTL
jgi:hypothetical protein